VSLPQVGPTGVLIRSATSDDLEALLGLVARHAEFEHATFDPTGVIERWHATLVGPSSVAHCLVAEAAAPDGSSLVGYATCSLEFSTWAAARFLHMDTLFVDERLRGRSIGAALMDAVIAYGRRCGVTELQWQTPMWNDRAIRFYERAGATFAPKARFHLPLQLQEAGPDERTH
jgi:ribosomal protein S18 acetylase RimI-like enzyme